MTQPGRSPVGAEILRQQMATGARLTGGWCTLPTSFATELVCHSGVDYAVVDMQHGLTGYSDLVSLLQAIATTPVVPMARIPYRDAGVAQRALDAGAYGLIMPMINSQADAEQAVAWCRYPPVGERSYGPIRARLFAGADPELANERVLCLVQIETRAAMTNLAAILAVPGIDGVYVGPADLALSHGLPLGGDDPTVRQMLAEIVAACREFNRIPGIHMTSGESAQEAFDLGYQMCSVGSDAVWLRAGYAEQIAIARATQAERVTGLY